MKIHRYIYTRLTKDLSPTGKNGFQSAFLPKDLLANKEVLEIESHIHFPEGLLIEAQSVVFYKTIKGQFYLVLLLLRPLTEVKDEHGRGGAFLCEGFLVPEQDWRPIWRISDLKELVATYQFRSLEALLTSPEVDRAAGRISDIDIDLPEGFWDSTLRDFEEEPEPQLLMAMYHVAKVQDRELAVVVEGLPKDVSMRLETCAMFMPEALRPRAAWDDAFDGGKVFFSPLRIFGYSELLPTTGRPVIFPADGSVAKWTEESMRHFGSPSDPFCNWLLEVCLQPVPRAKLDAMFALSEAMVNGRPTSTSMETDSVFEMVNRDAIRKLYIQGLSGQMDVAWATKLADLTSPEQQLKIWMQGYQIDVLARLFESCILHQNLNPEAMEAAPPPNIIRQGSAALQTLDAMWTLETPSTEVLNAIPENLVPDVLAAILSRGSHVDTPFNALVVHFRTYLHRLSREPKIAENVRLYIGATVPEEYDGFRAGIAATAMQAGEYGSLQGQPVDWMRLIDRWMATTGGNSEAWKAAKQLGKRSDCKGYPNLKAFAMGEAAFTDELERNKDGRHGFLRCLIEVHGFNEKKLMDMGFFESEIKNSGSAPGIMGKIKRLFGR